MKGKCKAIAVVRIIALQRQEVLTRLKKRNILRMIVQRQWFVQLLHEIDHFVRGELGRRRMNESYTSKTKRNIRYLSRLTH